MVTTTLTRMPSVNYDLASIRIVNEGSANVNEGSANPYLHVTTIEEEKPDYLRRKFADNVFKFLELTDPNLKYSRYDTPEGIFILGCSTGYDRWGDKRLRVETKIIVDSGKDGTREVIINPTIHSNGFLENYMSVLERDLVK